MEIRHEDRLANLRSELSMTSHIIQLFRSSTLIMDEVDMILHPLRSELNWPVGPKEPLDFTIASMATAPGHPRGESGLRWKIASHLLDLFFCWQRHSLAGAGAYAESLEAKNVLDELSFLLNTASKEKIYVSTSPHLIILDQKWYKKHLMPLVVRWMLLWLSGRCGAGDEDMSEYLAKGPGKSNSDVIKRLNKELSDESMKMLNLGFSWIGSLLPFVLSKTNRVAYGLLLPEDLKRAEMTLGIRASKSRRLLAVPFVGKDEPSATSEFSHPDVRLGFSMLSYKYEGFRRKDFGRILRLLREEMFTEHGPVKFRRSCLRWTQWVRFSGREVRGMTASEAQPEMDSLRSGSISGSMETSPSPTPSSSKNRGGKKNTSPGGGPSLRPTMTMQSNRIHEIARKHSIQLKEEEIMRSGGGWSNRISGGGGGDMMGDDYELIDDRIHPLHLIDLTDRTMMEELYELLRHNYLAIDWYLHKHVFPETMRFQELKVSACGQCLGAANMLFHRRLGFSGTPSDMLPIDLGRCQYDKGIDGSIVHTLASTDVVTHMHVGKSKNKWTIRGILDHVARKRNPRYVGAGLFVWNVCVCVCLTLLTLLTFFFLLLFVFFFTLHTRDLYRK